MGQSLGHLAVNTRPALVALTCKLVLHIQDVVIVEVSADVKSRTSGCRVVMDVEEARVQVQVSA